MKTVIWILYVVLLFPLLMIECYVCCFVEARWQWSFQCASGLVKHEGGGRFGVLQGSTEKERCNSGYSFEQGFTYRHRFSSARFPRRT
ncbi:hypothetical protein Hanom_Chr03g00206461 [Helianthus anomalus]